MKNVLILATLSFSSLAFANVNSYILVMEEQANVSAFRQENLDQRAALVFKRLREVAESSQREIKDQFLRQGKKFKSHYIVNAITVYGHQNDISVFWNLPGVERVIKNEPYRGIELVHNLREVDFKSLAMIPSNISNTNADQLWDMGSKGSGIVVASEDTGVRWDHPALMNQYRGYDVSNVSHDYNWHDAHDQGLPDSCGFSSPVPCDDHGHGTHTTGTMVGDDGGINQIGMAPEAKWIACRAFDVSGYSTLDKHIDCAQFFFAPFPVGAGPEQGDVAKRPDVINMSWGCTESEGCDGTIMKAIMNVYLQVGMMPVVAAGNSGSGCGTIDEPPAYFSGKALSVGAVHKNSGVIASFSSRGPSTDDGGILPHLVAPGVFIRSALPNGGFGLMSGTSMAAPHVAGAIALLWSHVPAYKNALVQTAIPFLQSAFATPSTQSCGGTPGGNHPNNTYGYGQLDVMAAATAISP